MGEKSQTMKTEAGSGEGWNLDMDLVHVGGNDAFCLIGVRAYAGREWMALDLEGLNDSLAVPKICVRQL